MTMTRRTALSAISLGGASLVGSGDLNSHSQTRQHPHDVVPLPFDAAKLRGLSERMIVSHHDNNYASAVTSLNKVEAELAKVTKDTPAFLVSGLKERELTFRNSVAMHELYFGNLGGDGALAGSIADAIGVKYGTAGRFEELFRATAMSLAGGSGWVALGHDLHHDDLVMYWSGGHTQNLAASLPVLVLDMYEHAFHLDYGAAAARYVEAFFANVNWQEVARRHLAAGKASAAMRG